MSASGPSADPAPPTERGDPPSLASVVVPAFNCRRTVAEQLEALDHQDYTGRWEIILVDNASTDGTRDILESWAAQRDNVLLVDARERRGAGYARNVGSRAANGDLLLFCDADDIVHPSWVSAMADGARFGALLTGVDVAQDGRWGRTPVGRTAVNKAVSRPGGFLPFARGGNLGVETRALWQVGGWDEDWIRGQDVELSWRLQLAGFDLLIVPCAIVAYRRPEGCRALLRHQFDFGRQAPRLRRHFVSQGAPPYSLGIALREAVGVMIRAPNLLRGPARRQAWLLKAAGFLGRVIGTIELRWRAQGPLRRLAP